MNGKCRAKTKTGAPCKALAAKDGFCALHADPSRASDLGRRSGKARRCVLTRKADTTRLLPPESVEDVRKALGRVMSDLIERRLDPRVASATAYVGNVLLKAIEVSVLEKRMGALEELLKTTGEGGSAERPDPTRRPDPTTR